MNITLEYINSKGSSFSFMSDYAFFSECELLDYKWEFISFGRTVNAFSRPPQQVVLPVVINGELAKRNLLHDICEYDIENKTPGKIKFGKWGRRCYVIESKKTSKWRSDSFMRYELTLLMIDPMWLYLERKHYSSKKQVSLKGSIAYPYNYPYNFGVIDLSSQIENRAIRSGDFRLVIYGACSNPRVVIGGNSYQVNVTLTSNEYLCIDSHEKSILKGGDNIPLESVFYQRQLGVQGSGSYIFEKIKSGSNVISWDNSFSFDLGIYEARSEPLWEVEESMSDDLYEKAQNKRGNSQSSASVGV